MRCIGWIRVLSFACAGVCAGPLMAAQNSTSHREGSTSGTVYQQRPVVQRPPPAATPPKAATTTSQKQPSVTRQPQLAAGTQRETTTSSSGRNPNGAPASPPSPTGTPVGSTIGYVNGSNTGSNSTSSPTGTQSTSSSGNTKGTTTSGNSQSSSVGTPAGPSGQNPTSGQNPKGTTTTGKPPSSSVPPRTGTYNPPVRGHPNGWQTPPRTPRAPPSTPPQGIPSEGMFSPHGTPALPPSSSSQAPSAPPATSSSTQPTDNRQQSSQSPSTSQTAPTSQTTASRPSDVQSRNHTTPQTNLDTGERKPETFPPPSVAVALSLTASTSRPTVGKDVEVTPTLAPAQQGASYQLDWGDGSAVQMVSESGKHHYTKAAPYKVSASTVVAGNELHHEILLQVRPAIGPPVFVGLLAVLAGLAFGGMHLYVPKLSASFRWGAPEVPQMKLLSREPYTSLSFVPGVGPAEESITIAKKRKKFGSEKP